MEAAGLVPCCVAEERRYDDREVGLILKRVAELHEREGDKVDARSMSRGEIEQVVTELGISRALVARAASEVSLRDVRNRPVWWLGGKTDVMFEDEVEGTVDDASLTAMIEVLRRNLADPGKLEHEGASRIWSTTTTSRRVFLTVVEHEGRTTIRLEERMPMDARTTVGTATFLSGFTAFLGVIPLKALVAKAILMLSLGPLALAGATVGWLGGRALWKRRSQHREAQLRAAFGEIMTLVRPALPPAH